MTDKQIIIDGVDVSGCAYFWNKECRCIQDCVNYSSGKPIKELFFKDTGIHTSCETSSNCYYKQLKRKEQRIVELNKTIKAKEQECERLKQNLSDLKKDLKFQNDKISELELDLQNANSTIENLDLMRVGEYNVIIDDYDKLKETLTEIKEIAETCSFTDNNKTLLSRVEQILQICDEVNYVQDNL